LYHAGARGNPGALISSPSMTRIASMPVGHIAHPEKAKRLEM